ncbi:hypothetical protein [Haemophilus haemolyticus]|uniref:hypothetical protein n=1 Tax=Haemophilus haemolyticus TaxID=726 RepID=UPI000E58C0DB|nr:hypothetical protein [Haemophilus haemolyticus]
MNVPVKISGIKKNESGEKYQDVSFGVPFNLCKFTEEALNAIEEKKYQFLSKLNSTGELWEECPSPINTAWSTDDHLYQYKYFRFIKRD